MSSCEHISWIFLELMENSASYSVSPGIDIKLFSNSTSGILKCLLKSPFPSVVLFNKSIQIVSGSPS